MIFLFLVFLILFLGFFINGFLFNSFFILFVDIFVFGYIINIIEKSIIENMVWKRYFKNVINCLI